MRMRERQLVVLLLFVMPVVKDEEEISTKERRKPNMDTVTLT